MAARVEPPLIVDGRAPEILPAAPLPWRTREGRPLFVVLRTIYLMTPDGWFRIPRGYVTDFGSIPGLATFLTLQRLQPLGVHAWAALNHDFGYAIGEPGRRPMVDSWFRARMEIDGVWAPRRALMYRMVRLGGGIGYRQAPSWWETENFVDPDTGLAVPPPFPREAAFAGGPFGLRERPDWQEPA